MTLERFCWAEKEDMFSSIILFTYYIIVEYGSNNCTEEDPRFGSKYI